MTLLRSVGAAIAVPALAASAVAQLPPAIGVPPASPVPLSAGPSGFALGPAPFSAPVPITPGPIGIAPVPPPPGPVTTLGSFLGLSPAQREYRQLAMADTPFGQLRQRVQTPLSKLTGGLIKPFPPQAPTLAQLMDPGAVGAAAKVKFDRLQAKQRIEAVKYLGTVDCHYWPEAEDALVGALRVDRNEWVRLAAAQTLLGGCCCTKKTITALSIAASCSDEDGNPREKSPRVVAAAQAALSKCLAAVCANPVVTEGPAVDLEKQKEVERERREGASAMPKPGPYGEEKAAHGLSPDEVVRPTGSEFYARVVRASWGEVIAFGKNKMASAPPVPVEFIRMAGTEAEPTGEERADRPANLMDYLFGDGPAEKAAPMAYMPPTAPLAPRSAHPTQAPALAVRPPVAQPTAPRPAVNTPALAARPAQATQPPAVPVRQPVAQKPAPVVVPASQPAAPAPMPTVRTAAADSPALGMLAGKADPRKAEDAVNAMTAAEIAAPKASTTLLKAAQTHADTGVRTACVRALARGKASNPLVLAGLEQLVGDRSVDVRVEAAVALSELKSGK